MRFFILPSLLLLTFTVARADWVPPKPGAYEQEIARLIADILPKWHYNHEAFDDDKSAAAFDKFLERLDYSRRYFLLADIEQFEKHRLTIDDELRDGNVDFAYEVYAHFVERVRERVEYVEARARQEFDFSIQESFTSDRKKAPWCTTEAERDEIWRRRIKSALLTRKLAAEEEKERQAAADEKRQANLENDETGKPTAEEASRKAAAEQQVDPDEDATADAEPEPPLTDEEQRQEWVDSIIDTYKKFLEKQEGRESIDVLEMYLSSVAKIYDPHSAYMAPRTREDFDIKMRLSLEGIGARLKSENGYILVVSIIDGGPAAKEGRLQVGDRIVAVRQENEEPVSVVDMPLRQAVRMIRGQKGSTAYLLVVVADADIDSKPIEIGIIRDTVQLDDRKAKITYYTTPGKIAENGNEATGARKVGVIRLPAFYTDFDKKKKKVYNSATIDIQRLLAEAKQKNVDGIILDFRRNKGGSMDEAITLAGLFVNAGPIVLQRSANGRVKNRNDTDPVCHWDGPLLIMVNHYSASSTEIFAAAIQDYKRGVIMGDWKTHGKGTLQTLNSLQRFLRHKEPFRERSGGTLRLTTGKFYRVNGGSTQRRGMTPDIVYPSFNDHKKIGDTHLAFGMKWDTIDQALYDIRVDVTPHIPLLREQSQARVTIKTSYDEFVADVAEAAERAKRKSVPLQIDERRAFRQESREWSKKVKKYAKLLKNKGTAKGTDWRLDEGMEIMVDLIDLTKKATLAAPREEQE
ncbi:MAG: carboxy terminal-processing peptidase [Lentisphaeria bacterium]